jgi:hypothetical protein
MNKYYPVIARAVERLDSSTGETRRAVYVRARKAVAQLRSNQPALLDADITKERLALEEAILKVEAEAVRNSATETWAEPRSGAPAVAICYDDQIQFGDHGQAASVDRDDRPPALSSRQTPMFLPSASDDRDNTDNIQVVAIGEAYGADHYYDGVPSSRWRGGFLVMMAMLALAVLAGTFAYRGVFGGDMFAALPSILKDDIGPDNMVRNNRDTQRSNSSQMSTTSAGLSEKQPTIDLREALKTPRVISAIPISSTPSAGAVAPAPTTPALDSAVSSDLDQHVAASVLVPPSAPVPVAASAEPNEAAAVLPAREQGAPSPALAPPVLTAASVARPGSAAVPVSASLEPTETAATAPAASEQGEPSPALAPPALTAASVPPASAPVPIVASSEPIEIAVGAPAPPSSTLAPPVLTAAPLPRPASAPLPVSASAEPNEVPTEPAAAAPTPSLGPPVLMGASVPIASAPVPIPTSGEPNETAAVAPASSPAASTPNAATPAAARLSNAAAPLVRNHGVQEDAAPSPSPGAPMQGAAAEVSSGGAYAVQLASESSAAEAHASFQVLRSKFPNQLGGREPIVRRTDLGAKGVYYRLMVGPFASMEKAAGMCSTLKAAGCNCLVQRN